MRRKVDHILQQAIDDLSSDESFKAFCDQHSIQSLQQLYELPLSLLEDMEGFNARIKVEFLSILKAHGLLEHYDEKNSD